MTTVTAVKRALEETYAVTEPRLRYLRFALHYIATSPETLTILANRLSDRGTAGNAASAANLSILAEQGVVLATLQHGGNLSPEGVRFAAALEWAIDQLTPPEPSDLRKLNPVTRELQDFIPSVTKASTYTVAKNPAGVGWVVVKDNIIQSGKFYLHADAEKRAAKLNEALADAAPRQATKPYLGLDEDGCCDKCGRPGGCATGRCEGAI